MMVLGVNGGALGGHLGGWRHPDSFPTTAMQLQRMIEIAKLAESGLIDLMFLADGNGVRQMDKPTLFAANSPSDRPAVFEPVTLFAALSQHTRNIGFVATATTSYEEPFMIARKFASLDHLSGGRAAWNLVTTQYVEDAKNFGRDEHMGREERYERARESLDVVRSLWDSWAEDAFVQNKETGQYLDPSKVRLTNHRGKYFKVKGPLNVARTPQGQPVVFMAGQSEAGKDLAAYGGGRMPLELISLALDLFPETGFTNAYGLTETSSTVALLGPDEHRAARKSDDPNVRARLVSVGKPLPTIELEIRDEDGNLGLNLGVYGAPETFFIDAKGVIRDKYVGVIDEVVWREQLAAKYQALVDEAKP